jgi:hypothetical protein
LKRRCRAAFDNGADPYTETAPVEQSLVTRLALRLSAISAKLAKRGVLRG